MRDEKKDRKITEMIENTEMARWESDIREI